MIPLFVQQFQAHQLETEFTLTERSPGTAKAKGWRRRQFSTPRDLNLSRFYLKMPNKSGDFAMKW